MGSEMCIRDRDSGQRSVVSCQLSVFGWTGGGIVPTKREPTQSVRATARLARRRRGRIENRPGKVRQPKRRAEISRRRREESPGRSRNRRVGEVYRAVAFLRRRVGSGNCPVDLRNSPVEGRNGPVGQVYHAAAPWRRRVEPRFCPVGSRNRAVGTRNCDVDNDLRGF